MRAELQLSATVAYWVTVIVSRSLTLNGRWWGRIGCCFHHDYNFERTPSTTGAMKAEKTEFTVDGPAPASKVAAYLGQALSQYAFLKPRDLVSLAATTNVKTF